MTAGGPRTNEYISTEKLDARIALHERFTPRGSDIWDFVWSHYDLMDDDHVLEVGCGTGMFWTCPAASIPLGLEVTLTDRSPGMVRAVVEHVEEQLGAHAAIVADVQRLPFADASYTVTLAHFMLYHVPDKARALRELHRVLVPGGRAGIVLTRIGHMLDLLVPLKEVRAGLSIAPSDADVFNASVAGPQIRREFPRTRRLDYEFTMAVTDAALLVAYAASMPRIQELELTRPEWAHYEELLQKAIDQDGAFAVTKKCSVFLCAR